MKKNNPMKIVEYRKKATDTLVARIKDGSFIPHMCTKQYWQKLKASPNKLEKLMLRLFQHEFGDRYKFSGDGSIRIGYYAPDFIDDKNKKIIEINGCYWHKCQICFPGSDSSKRDADRLLKFKAAGYKVETIWSHEIEDNLENVLNRVRSFTYNGKKILKIEIIPGYHKVVNFSCAPHQNYFANYLLSHNCTFCYWGSNLQAKVSTFSLDRLKQELEWMSDKKIEFVYAADANFGILARDVDIADMIIKSKSDKGYPKSFFINYSKNTGERVFDIAKKFYDADLSKGTTLSLQSLDEDVLDYVKRKNIKMSVFKDLQKKYRAAGIPSYTELILPLPGESLDTFVDGIEQTIEAGEHDQIYVYLCRLLPNTEMSSKDNRSQFQLKTKLIPILSSHVNLGQDSIGEKEFEEIVIETNTMPEKDCKMAICISWMVITNICLKTSYFISLYLFHELDTKMVDFLKFIIQFATENKDKCPIIFREQERFNKYIDGLFGEGDGEIDYSDVPFLPSIRWPMEEVSFIVYSLSRDNYYDELKLITIEMLKSQNKIVDIELLNQLFLYQKNRLIGEKLNYSPVTYNWDFYSFFQHAITNDPIKLSNTQYISNLEEMYKYDSLSEFVKYHVWFGRRRKHFYYKEIPHYV